MFSYEIIMKHRALRRAGHLSLCGFCVFSEIMIRTQSFELVVDFVTGEVLCF